MSQVASESLEARVIGKNFGTTMLGQSPKRFRIFGTSFLFSAPFFPGSRISVPETGKAGKAKDWERQNCVWRAVIFHSRSLLSGVGKHQMCLSIFGSKSAITLLAFPLFLAFFLFSRSDDVTLARDIFPSFSLAALSIQDPTFLSHDNNSHV